MASRIALPVIFAASGCLHSGGCYGITEREIPVTLPEGWTGAEKLLGNYPGAAAALRPYECTILKK